MSDNKDSRLEKALALSLDEFKAKYESDDAGALIQAIRFCGRWQLVMPDWVVDEFHRRTNPLYTLEVGDIGEALGIPKRSPTKLANLKRKTDCMFEVFDRVEARHQHGEPYGYELYRSVGLEFGINADDVKKIRKGIKRLRGQEE